MPDYNEQPVLTREMIDRLMRAYTGIGGMMYQGMPGTTTAEYAEYLDYDQLAHAPVLNIPRTYTFTTTAYPVEDISQEWLDFLASDGTDESWNEPEPEPDPEPCTETELTDFLGI